LWQDPEIAQQWRDRPPLPEVVTMGDLLAAEGRRRVLDIGCGMGRHTIYLAARGFEVTGTDNAPTAVAGCMRDLDRAGLKATLLELDMAEFPFPDGHFDGAISANVIHHSYRAAIARIIISITHKLSPGGIFVWAIPSPRHREHGQGHEVEPGTWVDDSYREGPVPHHYSTEAEIREWLAAYDIQSLSERQMAGRPERWHWYALARKRA
jgi:SAM-dependent methyltransferase